MKVNYYVSVLYISGFDQWELSGNAALEEGRNYL